MQFTRWFFLAGTCAAGATSVPRPAMAQTHPAATSITAALETYAEALKRGDGAAAASIFAIDGTLIVPGAFVHGRDAIAAFFTKRLETRRYIAATFTTVSISGGDVAVEIGTSQVTFADAGQPPRTVHGRYLTAWRKETPGGAWHIAADAPMVDPVPAS